jgi:3',5'-cyclic AMP phosphodiesterase CpdA
VLDTPALSYQGIHFFKHRFDGLPSGTTFSIDAFHDASGLRAEVTSATLKAPTGQCKLCIGLMADLHLSTEQASIECYHHGMRRLYGLANELASRYIKRLETLGAYMIVLTGDVVDPCTPETLSQLKKILDSVSIPCYPIIGNHEPWYPDGEKLFYQTLGLPQEGYYAVRKNGVLLIMLSTPSPDSLHNGSRQLKWLKETLDDSDPKEDILLFSHFYLLLHPCVQGAKNDGYQLLDNRHQILSLLSRYPNVRLFVAGHKNVPSIMKKDGIIHLLSPQLIQSPCGYDLLRLYDAGVMRTTYEIDEQHYCEVARSAYSHNWEERFGEMNARNFYELYHS